MFRSLSIIIPNYNGEELLKTFMPSVLMAANNYKGSYEIIIVDDVSPDGSRTILEEFKAKNSNLKVIYHETNKGFSGTCNTGMRAAKGEILFFLNNDVKLIPDFFDHFNSYFDLPDTFAVTACAYTYSDSKPLDGLKPGYWKRGMPKVNQNIFKEDLSKSKKQRPYLSFAVQGAYFFSEATKTIALGGFDELFSPYIFEETDLSYRALKRGWKIYFEPLCVAYHAVSSTISKKSRKKTLAIATKNKLIFVWKNIHSNYMLTSHIFFLFLRLLTFNITYIRGFRMAIKNLGEIREKREIEKQAAVLSDQELFRSFSYRL